MLNVKPTGLLCFVFVFYQPDEVSITVTIVVFAKLNVVWINCCLYTMEVIPIELTTQFDDAKSHLYITNNHFSDHDFISANIVEKYFLREQQIKTPPLHKCWVPRAAEDSLSMSILVWCCNRLSVSSIYTPS